jgi:glucan endo-1,3-beta-D-glucosidase
MRLSTLLALVALSTLASAGYKGFTYGSFFHNGTAKQQPDFEAAFNAAKTLTDAPGYNSARLFTTIQHNTINTPTSAIQAAINTNTSLLLGLWCSDGDAFFENELIALKAAITQYGQPFVDQIVGISVGSEDLFRASEIGMQKQTGPGVTAELLVAYLIRTRNAIGTTIARDKWIGHVDTWSAWIDPANKPVLTACNFIGMVAIPYFDDNENSVKAAFNIFASAYNQVCEVAPAKPIWIAGTGWPVVGDTSGQAVPSFGNARQYWIDVQCTLIGMDIPLYWHTLNDGPTSPSFSVLGCPEGEAFDQQPLYPLDCP